MGSHTVTIKQERGFVRLIVQPVPPEGTGLPSTYSSLHLAQEAAERLHRERGWMFKGNGHAN
ncbi:hypothetical protein ACFSAG_14100 [Sphingorhabdus buctiana]|uniref:WGR domain-containing protein n=1 Tax=Sphingorhabdus buctiana TaxID=1508805 RepID=A0ABW4MG99_9SPHN